MKAPIQKITLFLIVALAFEVKAQLGVASSPGFTPNAKAMLDISSTDKGLLIPRMTSAQRTGIATPPQGLSVFDTQTKSFWYFDGLAWKEMNSNAVATVPYYNAVTICCQSWMTKNLDVTTYRNGDPIPQITDPTAWTNATSGAWCYYDNLAANGTTYGKIYNWYAVNDPRGLAPEGWHIPTFTEAQTLIDCLGGSTAAGGKLKDIGTTHWTSPNTGASNTSGFRALGGGYRDFNYTQFKLNSLFWLQTTDTSGSSIYLLNISNTSQGATLPLATPVGFGAYVRCIRYF